MTSRTYERVSIPQRSRYSTHPLALNTPEGHAGEYTKASARGTWQKRVTSEIYLDGYTLEEIQQTFVNEAATMQCDVNDLRLDITRDYDDSVVTSLYGYRDATPEEVASIKAYQKWSGEQREVSLAQRKADIIAQAKAVGLTVADLT